jgi:hypothetical protein
MKLRLVIDIGRPSGCSRLNVRSRVQKRHEALAGQMSRLAWEIHPAARLLARGRLRAAAMSWPWAEGP